MRPQMVGGSWIVSYLVVELLLVLDDPAFIIPSHDGLAD